MTTRRNIIAGALIFASLAISPAQAQTQDKPTEIRIGTAGSFRQCGSAAR